MKKVLVAAVAVFFMVATSHQDAYAFSFKKAVKRASKSVTAKISNPIAKPFKKVMGQLGNVAIKGMKEAARFSNRVLGRVMPKKNNSVFVSNNIPSPASVVGLSGTPQTSNASGNNSVGSVMQSSISFVPDIDPLRVVEAIIDVWTEEGPGGIQTKVEITRRDRTGKPAEYKTTTTDAKGLKFIAESTGTYTFNANRKLTGVDRTMVDAAGKMTGKIKNSYLHDTNGKVASQETITSDDAGKVMVKVLTVNSFDAFGKLSSQNKTTTDGIGQVIKMETITVSYNANSNTASSKTVSTDANGKVTESVSAYSYDANGNAASSKTVSTDAKGNATESVNIYSYDTIGSIEKIQKDDKTYDASGNVISTSHTTNVAYNTLNAITGTAVYPIKIAPVQPKAPVIANNVVGATIMIKAVALPPVGGPQGGIAPDVVNPNQGQAGPAVAAGGK